MTEEVKKQIPPTTTAPAPAPAPTQAPAPPPPPTQPAPSKEPEKPVFVEDDDEENKPKIDYTQMLYKACTKGDLEKVKEALEKKPNISWEDKKK